MVSGVLSDILKPFESHMAVEIEHWLTDLENAMLAVYGDIAEVVSYVDFFIDRVYILLPCHVTYIEQLIDPSSYNVNSTVVYWLRYTT